MSASPAHHIFLQKLLYFLIVQDVPDSQDILTFVRFRVFNTFSKILQVFEDLLYFQDSQDLPIFSRFLKIFADFDRLFHIFKIHKEFYRFS